VFWFNNPTHNIADKAHLAQAEFVLEGQTSSKESNVGHNTGYSTEVFLLFPQILLAYTGILLGLFTTNSFQIFWNSSFTYVFTADAIHSQL
jgi:hypothetical protein